MMFLHQLRGELRKLFARKRTYIGYVVFLVFEALLLTLWVHVGRDQFEALAKRNFVPVELLSSSLTATYWIMGFSMFLLGSIYFALVSGDIVAKETEDGNMRMVLSRPVSRLRILILKYCAVIIYTVTFVIFVGITGYSMALLAMGAEGGLFIWNPDMQILAIYPNRDEAFWRLFMGACFMGLSMCVVSSLGFFFSCLKIKPAAASVMALSVFFIDFVLQNIPFLANYKDVFITYRMANWVYVLQEQIPWARITESYSILMGLNITLFTIGWMVFQSRDFKT
ncbi:MAG: ABC transporter permease [Akkermansiaceae bacterium]|jgi:ABC-2 type transport system permease protein|tara:strand:+ start:4795 stop:5640 length:846 start_codon:yes stop_codon:yes gene_type:complete